jgi:hypothetical protein
LLGDGWVASGPSALHAPLHKSQGVAWIALLSVGAR